MKITKLVHACLLVEMPSPVNRTALFDPGMMSMVDVDKLQYLDDIIITHNHGDHFDVELIKKLVAKFPDVHITGTAEVVERLNAEGIAATSASSEGIELFDSEHGVVESLFPTPQEHGYHYLGKLSHPGDSYTFRETKDILALPVQGPWGGPVEAVALALQLKPKYIIPIHDWHWSDDARNSYYNLLEPIFKENKITFIKAVNGEPFVLDV